MNDLEIIRGIVKNMAIVARKIEYTYIDRLFPEFGVNSGILLICKKILSPTNVMNPEMPDLKDVVLEATDHDVTGSPLRHSFGEDTFDVTIVNEKRNWSKDEENHFPMRNMEASTILNLCLEYLSNKKWEFPLFVLCDATDRERTILLGSFIEPEWFTTMKVCTTGLIGSSKIHDCNSLMQQHLALSTVPEREVKVTVLSIYEFKGMNKSTIDWSENERVDFEGYLSLELSWNSLSFLPPIRTTSNYLIGQVAAGWKGSPLRDLWDQLLLLNAYLTILETYQKKNLSCRYSVVPLKFPDNFHTPYIKSSDDLMEKLNLLLSGDDAFNDDYPTDSNNERSFLEDNDLDDKALLCSYLKELSSRQNLDFTDHLWQLIISSNDYVQMTDCIHAVFEEIVNDHYKPQINGNEPTRIAKIILELNSQKAAVPSLAGSLPLELVIDMGMEKMRRDYTYLLLSANLAEMNDMRQKLINVSTEDFSPDKYRKILLTMTQIHICLEFLLLVQNLDCSLDTSYSLFDHAIKLYTSDESPVKSFEDLIDNTIYTLKAPGSNALIKEVTKASPSAWRATLSSSQRASKFTTTTHYSLIPIFPPNIYSADDPIEGEENFHVTSATTCSYKIH